MQELKLPDVFEQLRIKNYFVLQILIDYIIDIVWSDLKYP